MSKAHMSRRGFIKRAAVGAAAASGMAAADYLPPGGEPDGNVVEHPNKVVVYPTGVEDADWANLEYSINEFQKDVHLMDRSKNGVKMNFKLPTCDQCDGYLGVEITRDVNIIGHGNPKGANATIEGGLIAFADYGHHNVSIQKVSFLNQEFSAVYGSFNDFVFKGNQVAVDPMPLPEPSYGVFLEEVTNSMQILKNEIKNQTGFVCKGATSGKISQNRIESAVCGVYASGVQNTSLKGNVVDVYNGGLAGFILDGTASNNEVKAGKLKGEPYFGAVVLGSGNPTNNRFLMIDVKQLDCTEASIGINPLNIENVYDTIVKGGPGSVSVDPMPLPKPRDKVLDNGIGSQITHYGEVLTGAASEGFASLLESFRWLVEYPFEGGD